MQPSLTGNKRYRSFLGKLVLQVQEVAATWQYPEQERVTIYSWRDATIEDLCQLNPSMTSF